MSNEDDLFRDPYADCDVFEIDTPDRGGFETIIVFPEDRHLSLKEIYAKNGLAKYYRTPEQDTWDAKYGWMTEEEKKRWGAPPRPTGDEE